MLNRLVHHVTSKLKRLNMAGNAWGTGWFQMPTTDVKMYFWSYQNSQASITFYQKTHNLVKRQWIILRTLGKYILFTMTKQWTQPQLVKKCWALISCHLIVVPNVSHNLACLSGTVRGSQEISNTVQAYFCNHYDRYLYHVHLASEWPQNTRNFFAVKLFHNSLRKYKHETSLLLTKFMFFSR